MNISKQRCPKCVGSFLRGDENCPACRRVLHGLAAVSARATGPIFDFESLSTRVEGKFSEFVERFFTSERESVLESLSRWNHPVVLAAVVLAIFTVVIMAQLS